MRMERRTILAWLATALLLVLCLAPKWTVAGEGPSTHSVPHTDKVVHFGLFTMFGALWARAGGVTIGARRVAIVLAASLALAVGTEVAQGLPVIARDPDPLDALADSGGGLAGVALAIVLARTRPETRWERETKDLP
jgi:hypothetical protein